MPARVTAKNVEGVFWDSVYKLESRNKNHIYATEVGYKIGTDGYLLFGWIQLWANKSLDNGADNVQFTMQFSQWVITTCTG